MPTAPMFLITFMHMLTCRYSFHHCTQHRICPLLPKHGGGWALERLGDIAHGFAAHYLQPCVNCAELPVPACVHGTFERNASA